MTTTTPNLAAAQAAIAHQLAEMAAQLESSIAAVPSVDPKFAVTAEFIELPKAAVDKLIKEYRKAETKFKAAKDELENAKRKIVDEMGGAEVLVVAETNQQVVEHRVVTGMVFDTTRFKQVHPEMIPDFLKTRVQRPFRIL